jgi:glutamate/tyrosine decarboxylase-like PLP-dependent enzyme
VAGAWATLQFLGVDGYKRIAGELMAFIDAYKDGIRDIAGLHVLGAPDLSIVAYGSNEVDIFRVAEVMAEKGWLPGLVQRPRGIHRMMSMLHAPVLDAYLEDVRAAMGVVRQAGAGVASIEARY